MEIGLSIVAAASVYAAYKTENGARCLAFMTLAFFAILGAAGA